MEYVPWPDWGSLPLSGCGILGVSWIGWSGGLGVSGELEDKGQGEVGQGESFLIQDFYGS